MYKRQDLAEKKASECKDGERKMQLLTMAENCRIVPENAPQNFCQAAQFVWFTHLAIMMEYNSNDNCLGRFDQYMYPFYKQDIESGINEAFLADVIHEFKLKIAELWEVRTTRESIAYPCLLYTSGAYCRINSYP